MPTTIPVQEWGDLRPKTGAILRFAAAVAQGRGETDQQREGIVYDVLALFTGGLGVAVYDPAWARAAWADWRADMGEAPDSPSCDARAIITLATTLANVAARWPDVPMPPWISAPE